MDYKAETSNLRSRIFYENVQSTSETCNTPAEIDHHTQTCENSKVDDDQDYILSGVLLGTLTAIIIVSGYALWSIYISFSSASQPPDDCSSESVEDLRRRLNSMKQLMNQRSNSAAHILNGDSSTSSTRNCSVIDDKFLSVIFMFVLGIIVTVSMYAFYNLYTAIVKKFSPKHDEL